MTRKRYTQEEEQIILQEVSTHADNICKGLLIASEKIGRSVYSVRNYWYKTLSKKPEVAFCIFNKKSIIKNRKVIRTKTWDNKINIPVNLFKRILRWIKPLKKS